MINIGIGISWVKALYSVAANIVANFRARVAADNGIFEAAPYLDVTLDELNAIGLLDKASLITTPNAYKESKLYSVVPSDGAGDMTVVRATTATRVNSEGLIETSPVNLLTYSEQFDNAAWTKINATITSNSIAAPNGTTTADLITSTGTSETGVYIVTSFTGTNTWSVYAKKGTGRYLFFNTNTPLIAAKFDLQDGVIVGTPSAGATPSIESIGNGWYRCIITSSTATNRFTGFITNNTTTSDLTSSVGLSYYLWGAQVNTGTLKPYFPTTTRLNIPRIDYTSGQGAILVEPQRTNLLTYSEQFDNASWTKLNGTVSANQAEAPDGTISADLFYPTTSGTDRLLAQNKTGTIGQTFTSSAFVKSSGVDWVLFYAANIGGCWFNASTGVFGTVGSGVTASVLGQVNGFWRISLTATIANTNVYFYIGTANANGTNTITKNGTDGILVWGAQIEQASYATSYIPTVASTSTRNADLISKNPSSFLGSNIGTWLIDVEDYEFQIKGTNDPTTYIGDSTSDYIGFNAKLPAYDGIVISKRESGTVTTMYQNALKSLKACFVWNGTSLKLFVNGSNVYTNNSFANFASWDTFELNNSSRPASYKCNLSLLFPTALTDQECINLTTI